MNVEVNVRLVKEKFHCNIDISISFQSLHWSFIVWSTIEHFPFESKCSIDIPTVFPDKYVSGWHSVGVVSMISIKCSSHRRRLYDRQMFLLLYKKNHYKDWDGGADKNWKIQRQLSHLGVYIKSQIGFSNNTTIIEMKRWRISTLHTKTNHFFHKKNIMWSTSGSMCRFFFVA